jgi:hypothetical protein
MPTATPNHHILPFTPGEEYVVAYRTMPTFDLFGHRHDELPWRKRMSGEIVWVDNQSPPWLCIRRKDGKKFRVCATEICVRYLHGLPKGYRP